MFNIHNPFKQDKKQTPSNQEFIKKVLIREGIYTNREIVNEYINKYLKNAEPAVIAWKGYSLQDRLRALTRDGKLEQVERKNLGEGFGCAIEISYKLSGNVGV